MGKVDRDGLNGRIQGKCWGSWVCTKRQSLWKGDGEGERFLLTGCFRAKNEPGETRRKEKEDPGSTPRGGGPREWKGLGGRAPESRLLQYEE